MSHHLTSNLFNCNNLMPYSVTDRDENVSAFFSFQMFAKSDPKEEGKLKSRQKVERRRINDDVSYLCN